ncbi:MAG: M3 family metallopeptidase [Alphaproteobacteria bacterium]
MTALDSLSNSSIVNAAPAGFGHTSSSPEFRSKNSLTDLLPPELSNNPFFHFSEDTNYIPAWDKINPEHVMPAIEFVLEKMKSDIRSVIEDKKKPNFKNTIDPIESSFSMPIYFFLTLYNILPANDEEEAAYDKLQDEAFLKFIDAFNETFLDKKLIERIKEAVQNTQKQNLSIPRQGLVYSYKRLASEYGRLSEKKKAILKDVERELTVVSSQSLNAIKKAQQETGIYVSDEATLKGLPDFLLQIAQEQARQKGYDQGWFFNTNRETFMVFKECAEDGKLRESMWKAFYQQTTKGEFDNRATIIKYMQLLSQSAKILGYKNPAHMILRDRLAGNIKNVSEFLIGLRDSVIPHARKEINALRKFAKENDGIEKLRPWDVSFYQQKMAKEALGFDTEDLRPYFELENVIKGTLQHFEKLYKVRFESNSNYPVTHEDIKSFDVKDIKTGKHMGIIFMDLLSRKGKPAGLAWNISVLPQGLFEGKVGRPIDTIVTKFAKSASGEPTLLSHEEVTILFHELGHAMHNVLSECYYPSQSGTSVRRDFVEFPSQLMENWAYEPEVLAEFAQHYITGESLGREYLEKIKKSKKFMPAFNILEQAKKSWLDLMWHIEPANDTRKIADFERSVTRGFNLVGQQHLIFSTQFSHVFGGGYGAGYYSYQFAEAMESAVFELFEEKGVYNSKLSSALRSIIRKGASYNEGYLFQRLVNQEVTLEPLLRRAGLIKEDNEVVFELDWDLDEPELTV